MADKPSLDPTMMSDDDLRSRCAALRSEAELERVGCGLPMMISAIAIVGVALLTGRFVGGFVVVVGGAILFGALCVGLLVLFTHLASSRRRPFRNELSCRYGLLPLSRYVDEERLVQQADSGLASSIFLSVVALPHGGVRWIRIRIWKTPEPRAHVEVRSVSWRGGSSHIEEAELFRGEADLLPESRAEIEALVDPLSSAALGPLRAAVLDGLRCNVTVLHRGIAKPHCGSCNLAGLTAESRNHPTPRFAQMVLRAASVIPMPSQVTGSCDATGNIKIDTI